jgi:hypothetical protein
MFRQVGFDPEEQTEIAVGHDFVDLIGHFDIPCSTAEAACKVEGAKVFGRIFEAWARKDRFDPPGRVFGGVPCVSDDW